MFVIAGTQPPISRVSLRFVDGDTISAGMIDGLAIFAIPRAHLSAYLQRPIITGYDDHDRELQSWHLFYRANR